MDNPYSTPSSAASPIPSPEIDTIAQTLEGMTYPLELRFKIIAFAPQATLTDATGRTILFTRQKLFKLREHIEIFTDKTRSKKLAEIRANKVIDWSARYTSTDAFGFEIGSVGRRGWRSIWRAHYEVFNPASPQIAFQIREENAWAKFFDGLFGQIPILGIFSGYLFHPRYLATRITGEPTMRMTKRPAFLEGRFGIEKLSQASPREDLNLMLAFLMLILLERRRG